MSTDSLRPIGFIWHGEPYQDPPESMFWYAHFYKISDYYQMPQPDGTTKTVEVIQQLGIRAVDPLELSAIRNNVWKSPCGIVVHKVQNSD